MAAALTSLSPPSRSGTYLDGEKTIWAIVIPVSIVVPCLIAYILYLARRRRQRLAERRQPTSDGDVPIEVHQQAWLEHMRRLAEQNQGPVFATENASQPMTNLDLHDTTRHTRSQSTPSMLPTNDTPQREDSPLRRERHQIEGICDKEILELRPPQAVHPAVGRESS